ncbi:MAG: sensor domain-containing diguanylate cyclase [Pseudomonadota bacterium]
MAIKAFYKGTVAYVVYSAILIVSIITMLLAIRIILMEGQKQIGETVATNIGNIESSFTKGAAKVLKDSGQEIIRLRAEKVAKDIENYLIDHSRATIKDMQRDPQFKSIAVQSVGKTGYTAVYEANTSISRFHVDPKIVDTSLGALADGLPDFWKIIMSSKKGENGGGYYKWREADGRVREKYMWVASVSRPTADGVILQVAATTYIDEFMQPLARLSEKLYRESAEATSKIGGLSEKTQSKALIAIAMIILVFCGIGGYLAFRLVQGYRHIEREIRERDKAEEALRESEEKYRSLINNVNIGVYRSTVGENGRFIQANPAVARIFGYNSADEFMKVRPLDLYQDSDDRKTLIETSARPGAAKDMELRYKRKDGSLFFASVTARAKLDEKGNILWIDGVIEDITDRKRMEEEIKALAITDQLTGLYNRRGFITLSEQQLKIAGRTDSRLLLLFADLDGMKWINDNLGHLKGDEALVGVAKILKKVFREADIVARVGGDEFAVLALGTPWEYPDLLKDRLQQQIDLHNCSQNRDYHLSLSIGIAESDPSSVVSIDDLMFLADERMYENKKSKKDHPCHW